jgi:hypothetical protein
MRFTWASECVACPHARKVGQSIDVAKEREVAKGHTPLL